MLKLMIIFYVLVWIKVPTYVWNLNQSNFENKVRLCEVLMKLLQYPTANCDVNPWDCFLL